MHADFYTAVTNVIMLTYSPNLMFLNSTEGQPLNEFQTQWKKHLNVLFFAHCIFCEGGI